MPQLIVTITPMSHESPSNCSTHMIHVIMKLFASCKVKDEHDEDGGGAPVFSPDTSKLIAGLGDSPESLQLKAEILKAANELKRGQP